MGDLQAWAIPVPVNGVLREPATAASMSIHVAAISDESWRRAEEVTREVVERIQPTVVSEKRRKAVVHYVQKLIRGYRQSDVYPYGSVPLKTYLPDGDIDLTVFGMPNIEDALANDVRSVLEMEVKNKYAEFQVKDVQYIHAEVKLVKCLVQNIVVDISFNQMGGLCTLCFLEQVDRLIGKDHLFKRSIMLIKAWCYYESRILGAHHSLISTYALETLVLYIFHLFHASLDGPLEVLYRFLDYYSKFDWDNYCISLYGPVSVSSLPELVAEAPESDGGDLLLTKEFLRNCVDSFSVLPRGFDSKPPFFPQKHLNIVDPLKESNNLGRSVSRANFYRIRSAFSYGARKLGRILLLPSNCIGDEVNMFFTNTLERHGSGERPDVEDILPKFSGSELTSNNGMDSTPSILNAIDPDGELCQEINKVQLSGLDDNCNGVESNGLLDSRCLVGDATDHATSSTQSREGTKTPLSAYERSRSLPGTGYFVPQLFSHPDNGHENGGPCQKTQANLGMVHSVSLTKSLPSYEESRLMQPDSFESESSPGRTSLLNNHGTLASSCKANLLENSYAGDCSFAGGMGNGGVGSSRLPDLSGDYELHYKNLVCAQWIQEYASGTLFLQSRHSSSSYQYHNKHSWDPARHRGVYTHMNANGVSPGPPFLPSSSYPIAQPFISGIYGSEDLLKPRGTGTYFPNTNYRSTYKERHSPGRGRTPAFYNHLSRNQNNGRAETPQDINFQERSTHQPPEQSQLLDINGNAHGMQVLSDVAHPKCPVMKETSANTFVFLPEGRLEFGSFGPLPLRAPSTEPGKRSESVIPQMPGSGQVVPASTMLRPSSSSIPGRFSQAYKLKDDGDFPPLNG